MFDNEIDWVTLILQVLKSGAGSNQRIHYKAEQHFCPVLV